jgi:hypothetical protein
MTFEEMEAKINLLESRLKALEKVQAKVEVLEDIEEIQKLQKSYGYYLENMLVEDIVDLFSDGDDVELWVTAGKFKGKAAINRLYSYIRSSFPENKEFLHQLIQLSGIVHVNPDGRTARGRWYGLGVNALPLKNGKVNPGWMNGIYEMEYIKENGQWKIRKLRWCMTFRASWTESFIEASRRDDSPMDRSDNPNLGPRGAGEETRYPSGFVCPFHFANPVSGRKTIVES